MNIDSDTQGLRNLRLAMVVFSEYIRPDQLRLFRGAAIALAEGDPMFHNHLDEGYNYSYPKIQYKLIDRHPMIFGLEEGADRIADMLAGRSEFPCRLGRDPLTLHVHSFAEWEEGLGISETPQVYAIEDWMPLNARNFKSFKNTLLLTDRIQMLEGILTANILSFAKGMDMIFSDKVKCRFCELRPNGGVAFKKMEMLSYTGTFISNAVLPKWIGLGKSASLGHGTIITAF